MTHEFVSLADLLHEGVSVGALATAIERFGVRGWDRYGRFQLFKEASCEDRRFALDLLAQQASHSGDPLENSPLDQAELEGRSGYRGYGWLRTERPDFKSIEAQQPTVPRPPGVVKSDNSNLVIIGALLECIAGKWDGVQQHPDFSSEAALVKALSAYEQRLQGLGERNLEKKFLQAKQEVAYRRELKR